MEASMCCGNGLQNTMRKSRRSELIMKTPDNSKPKEKKKGKQYISCTRKMKLPLTSRS